MTQKGSQCSRNGPPPDYLCGQHDSGKCREFVSVPMPMPMPMSMPMSSQIKAMPRPPLAPAVILSIPKPALVSMPVSLTVADVSLQTSAEKVVEALKTVNDFYMSKKKSMTIETLANVLCSLFTTAKPGQLSIKKAQSPYIEKILKEMPAIIARDTDTDRREYNTDIVLKSAKALKFMFDTVCGFNDGGTGTGTKADMATFISNLTEIGDTIDRHENYEAMTLRLSLMKMAPSAGSKQVHISEAQRKVAKADLRADAVARDKAKK